ncbi:MAG TPA: amidase family protein [Acidimicrobiales bacterium]|nr:amidase family protein [Acidimicrobiales bacterium]
MVPVDPFTTAVEMVRLLRAGEVSSRDLVELHLERIARLNGRVNAVVTVDEAGARRRADELDRHRADGGPIGLLHGLPLTVKDCWATRGMRTTAGAREMADHVPEADAEVVARLRAAGAVVVGKTNLPENVTGQETANALFGRTCNPWDPDRTPGGSSGGGAAAVAAGLSPLEVGSDSGGSIREPAHCCGVYGHFPTSGLVPLAGHLPSVPVEDVDADVDLMAAGPLARDADDLALAMRVLAGLRPLGAPPAPERLRVAVWLGPSEMPPSQDVASLVGAAGEALASAGASVREAAPPFDAAEARDVAFQLWVAASASSASDDEHARAVERAAGTAPEDGSLSALRDRAQAMSHRDWLRLDARRRSMARSWATLLEEVDVVMCPVSPVPAVRHDPVPEEVHSVDRRLARTITADGRDRPYLDQIMWNVVVGVAGLPSTVAPVGRTEGGLPVGAQVVARRGADALTIAVAGLVGALTGGYAVPPGFA